MNDIEITFTYVYTKATDSIKSRGFKLANLNVTSLVKHIDELRILLADTPVEVLSINETRLDDSVKDNDVYIPGY